MDRYYKASGKFSPSSIVLLLITSCIIMPILGFIYSYAIWYIPIIYINIVITALFGYAIGFVTERIIIVKGKVRNSKIGVLFGLIGTMIALYFHWAVWIDLVMNAGEVYGTARGSIAISNIKINEVLALAVKPTELVELIKEVNIVGTWNIKATRVNGTFLSIIWIIETLIIVGMALYTSYKAAKKPFCETGNTWFKEKKLSDFIFINDQNKLVTDLENGQYNFFTELTKVTDPEESHSVFTLYYSDNGEYYLTIDNKKAKPPEKGKVSFSEDTVVEYISIPKSAAEILEKK